MEGLRLSSGIGSRMARISPDKNIFYGDLYIPAGTPVSMTAALMNTDEALYPDPLSFNPDSLTWAEMYLILAALTRRFDFNFQDVTAKEYERESDQYTIGVKAGTILKARFESSWIR
ncbi:hypothetical protein PFICI_00343 [Pestalotiopsis fici W106-1]|uniref:Uncharacterized protein n=1 Tax=Pestalotiopsis fici (strain W106-1 / CGMCC3.15140) TaxID=1229662 RepID=W3XKI1_PESFW|nr:uncharacterized protein PFICI_00343 [Pestalotiopsis fici W106-1]ETS86515.1 hypothetical protein PFICI_00343 [Pestalotiopsis fici W106-1]